MSVKTDVVNLRINVGGDKAQNELNELRKKAADLKFEMEGVNKRTKEYAAKKAELAAINTQMGELKKTIGLASLSQRELNKELKTLTSLRSSVVPFSEEYKKLDGRIKQVKDRLYEVNNGVRGFSATWSKVKDEVKQFGMLAAGYLGFQFITQSFGNMIMGAGKLSDSLADLQRVTGLTAKEAKAFNEELKLLDTRTATQGLREIAIVAGKLGVAKEDLLGFTQAVDMLVVALGDELGNADAITSTLGKILQVFDGRIDGDNITRLGNAIVELANTGSSTGAFISDFDQRLSGIAKSANIGLGALSGLGAGLEELGGRVESSATAIQKVIISIAADIPKAAQIAGVELSKFQQMFANTPQEALLQYARGLVQNKQSFSEITNAFKDAGEEGARVIETLSKLGQNTDFLRSRMELGSKALQENGAITEAFNLKNQTLGATIDKLSKEFNKLIASDGVQKFLKGLVETGFSLVKGLQSLVKWLADNATALKFLAAAILVNNAARIKSIALLAIEKLSTISLGKEINILRASKLALAAVTNLLTLNLTKAGQAFRLLSILIRTNPLGLLLTGIGSALLLLSAFSKKTGEVASGIKRMNVDLSITEDVAKKMASAVSNGIDAINQQTKIINSNTASLEQKKEAVQRLIDLDPVFLKGLSLTNDGHLKGAELLDLYIKKLKEKAIVEALASKRKDLVAQLAEGELIKGANTTGGVGDLPEFGSARAALTLKDTRTSFQKDNDRIKKIQEANKLISEAQAGLEEVDMLAKKFGVSLDQSLNGNPLTSNSTQGSTSSNKSSATKTEPSGPDIYDRLYNNALTQKPIQFPKVVITPENLEQVKEQYNALIAEANKALNQTQQGRVASLELNVMLTRGKEQLEAKQRLLLEETAMELKNTELTEQQKDLIRQRYLDKKRQLEIDFFQSSIDRAMRTVAEVGNATMPLLQNFYAFKNAQDNADLAREKKINDAKQKLYKKQLDNKLISQAQFDKKVAEAQEQFDAKDRKVRRKQAEREQRVKIYQAVITGIMSVLQTLASVPFPFNIPLGAAQAAAAGFQVAAIKKEPLPELGKGALLRRGPKHNSKSRGMPIVNPETGQVEALVERGEAVLSSRAMDDRTVYEVRGTTSQITSALNGRAGGRTWQGGASLRPISSAPGWMSSPGPSIKTNMPSIMADGGIVNPTASINIEAMLEEQRMSRMEIAALRSEMANWQTQLRAVVSIKEFREVEKQYDQARTQSGI